ncbi:MAG: hypothetical protein JO197_15480 [Acidobacteria bacterium]|nr:hypothetical protein [Acidobacteriota bacterium]MBV9475076.1 hypothetical protein [Acidobacteriota bacterium]
MSDAIRALDDLQPLPSKIHGFLQEAVPIALQHFDEWAPKKQNGDPTLDPHLFPHLVRWHVCRLLRQAEYDATLTEVTDDDTAPSIRMMAMSGVEILYRGRKLKLWKSRKGGIPLPGRSGSRKAFLEENRILFDANTEEFFNAHNLVLLWDVDGTGDVSLELVCPMPSDYDRDDVDDWKYPQLWAISVPDAATLVRTSAAVVPDAADQDYANDFGRIEPDADVEETEE